jgi:AcrR family transcriptional regulator
MVIWKREPDMGISERREREREEVREKILEAARDLFTTEGYDKVTMRGIAEAIEYSPATIYLHFEDKNDLVEALCNQDFGHLLEAMEHAPVPADPVEAVRELGRAYVAFALDRPNQFRFMFLTPHAEKEENAEDAPGSRAFRFVLDAARRAVAAGRFRPIDPVLAAQILWMSVHGVASALVTMPPEHWPLHPAASDLVDRVIENTLRGLAARPEGA